MILATTPATRSPAGLVLDALLAAEALLRARAHAADRGRRRARAHAGAARRRAVELDAGRAPAPPPGARRRRRPRGARARRGARRSSARRARSCWRCSRCSRCRFASRCSRAAPAGSCSSLYVVIAAGALALVLWGEQTREPPRRRARARARRSFVVLYAMQALYTPAASLAKAVEDVGFFLVPFSLLFVLLRACPGTARCSSAARARSSRWRSCSSPSRRSSTPAAGCCSTPR